MIHIVGESIYIFYSRTVVFFSSVKNPYPRHVVALQFTACFVQVCAIDSSHVFRRFSVYGRFGVPVRPLRWVGVQRVRYRPGRYSNSHVFTLRWEAGLELPS